MNFPNPLFDTSRDVRERQQAAPALFLVPVKAPRMPTLRGVLLIFLVMTIALVALARAGYVDMQTQMDKMNRVPAMQRLAQHMPLTGEELKQDFIAWRKGRAGEPSTSPARAAAGAGASSETVAKTSDPNSGESESTTWKDDLAKRSEEWQKRMKSLESAQAAESTQPPKLAEELAKAPATEVGKPSSADTAKPSTAEATPTATPSERAVAPVEKKAPRSDPMGPPLVGAQRIDFQVRRGRATQIAPGIALVMKRALVRSQQLDADLLLPSRRTLKLVRHSANEPLRFYQVAYARTPAQLVITDIGEDFAMGYVLLPRPGL